MEDFRLPDLEHLDEALAVLIRARTRLLIQLDQLNKEIDSILLAQEHLKNAADLPQEEIIKNRLLLCASEFEADPRDSKLDTALPTERRS